MSWAEIFGQIGFHCDFFVFLRDHLLMRESFNFQPTTKKVICSARNLFHWKYRNSNYGFLTLASAIYVH